MSGLSLADRLRVNAAVAPSVTVTLPAERARRLADQLDAGETNAHNVARLAAILVRREAEMERERWRLVWLGALMAMIGPMAVEALFALLGVTPEMARALGEAMRGSLS